MAAKHVLLVDGNSIAHANHNANQLSVGGFQVQAIFGVLKSMRHLSQETPGDKSFLVLWDGRAQWRLNLYPEYKGNRNEVLMSDADRRHKEAFKRQTPFIEKALSLLGVRQMRSPLLEADDLAGIMAPKLSAAGVQVTLVSGDQDWIQLVDENVSWYDPIRDRRVDHFNFFEKTGYFNPAAFVQGKALQGDGSDNIDGIAGMGEKSAALFMATWKDVNLFFKAVDEGTHVPKARASKKSTSLHPEQILASDEGRSMFYRNMKLMDLKQTRRPEPGEIITRSDAPNTAGFTQLCEKLSFASILRELPMFLRAFNIKDKAA